MPCEDCPFKLDEEFAAERCKQGNHAVLPVIREYPDGEMAFYLACPYCDRLFSLMVGVLGGMVVREVPVDREELEKIREREPLVLEKPLPNGMQSGSQTSNLPGEVIEAEILPPEEDEDEEEEEEEDDDDEEGGGNLYRF